ncbi:hypothetical protein B0H11DRAFT_565127 [Mycena galericulata]|nr:hypothetical protein B0H11DRAFT_565127 [Mycena galericulata]
MSNLFGNHQLRSRIQPVLAPSPGTIHTLHAGMNGESKNILRRFRTLLLQSPTLARILQARRVLIVNGHNKYFEFLPFFAVHNLLDVSWDDILQCIWSLRPFITRGSHNFPVLFILHPALCQLDGLYPDAMVSRDLGCGFLRLIRRIQNGGLPEFMWDSLVIGGYDQWGRHIRSSPPADPELLQELDESLSSSEIGMYSYIEDLHDVVQWLKTSPAAQPNLIHHWQTYLDKRIHQYAPEYDYDYDKLEKSWQDHLDGEVRFQGPEIDEEAIRCWETCLHKYIDTEGEQDV